MPPDAAARRGTVGRRLAGVCLAVLTAAIAARPAAAADAFAIGPDAFLLDGKPVQLIAGEMHYARIPAEDWRQRLRMARAMGLNAVATYCFWNLHQPDPGPFHFTGRADVARFCRIAQEEGLKVILRPGPYACAEWEFGGYPAWLLKDHALKVRTGDPAYERYAAAYLEALGEQLAPLQVDRGGPIILVQVENEYGSFGHDKAYLARLLGTLKQAGFTGPFFTSDGGNGMMRAGSIAGVLPGLNGGGSDVFDQINRYRPRGPYFVPEFYPGWLDHWGEPHQTRDPQGTADALAQLINHGVSVSLYMFHGGTNWDGMSGANVGGRYQPQPTSYDYDAPLDESGRPTRKYFLLRDVILKHLSPADAAKVPPVPAVAPPIAIAPVRLSRSTDVLAHLPTPVTAEHPLSMEDIGQNYGYLLYRTHLTGPAHGTLKITDLADYGYVSLNGHRLATLDRRLRQSPVTLDVPPGPATLDVLVENMGRINYGGQLLHNRKGITDSVTLAGRELTGWEMVPITPPFLAALPCTGDAAAAAVPAVYEGRFDLPIIGDTFLDLRPWTKGRAFVNGHDLGRYWTLGPQQTLFLPGAWLKPTGNIIKVFEQEKAPAEPTVAGLDHAILDVLNKPRRPGATRMKRAPTLPAPAATGAFADGGQDQDVRFPPTPARYVALQALSSQKGDDFANAAELNVLDEHGQPIPQDQLHVAYADSEENLSDDGSADNVLDGDPSTLWHTQYNGGSPPHPHLIVLDLGRARTVTGLQYTPRDSDSPGRIKDYRVYAWQP